MEKAVAPHSSTLACKIPWAEEPGRLQSMGLLGVGHYLATKPPPPACIYINPDLPIYPYLLSQMEKALATHSSTLAWKIPWTEEPGRLHSMGSLRVRHD